MVLQPSTEEFLTGWCGRTRRLKHIARAVAGGAASPTPHPATPAPTPQQAAQEAGAPVMSASPLVITAVKCFAVSIPTEHQLWNQCLVKIEAADGTHGWGESGLVSRELAVKGAVEHFSQFLVGRDANQISSLWQEMYRSQYFGALLPPSRLPPQPD